MKRLPDPEASDRELLRELSKGSEEAFLTLYRRHQGGVFRFALYMSGSREIAEEVVQEVFLALLSSPRDYDPDRGPLEAYLIGSARNHIRRHRRETRPARMDSSPAETPPDCAREFERAEELADLRRAVLSLPANYREVIALCDMQELSYEEAAARLGCAVGTVRSRLHRARGILTAKMRRACAAKGSERCSV